MRIGTYSKFLLHGVPNPSLVEAIVRRGLPVVSLGSEATLAGLTSLVPVRSTVSGSFRPV